MAVDVSAGSAATALDAAALADAIDPGSFAGLCELATVVCARPIAGVFLVGSDGERRAVWHGIDRIATPLSDAPCGLVVARGEPVLSDDLLTDERFPPPAAADVAAGLRAYAGVPVRAPDGTVVGAICTLDRVPGTLPHERLRALELLADQASLQLEAERRLRETARATREAASAELALRVSERRLTAVLEGIHDAVLLEDDERVMLVANRAFRAFIGVERSQVAGLLGDDVGEHMRAAFIDFDAMNAQLHEARVNGRPVARTEVRMRDGRTLLRDYTPITLEDGRRGHLWHLRDVTEQRRAEEALASSERRFHALASAAPIGIFANDATGRAVFFSDHCARLFGVDGPEDEEHDWADAVHVEDRPRVRDAWGRAIAEQTSFVVRYRVHDRDGELRELEIDAVPVRDPEGLMQGFVGTVHDVTELAAATRDLARTRAHADVQQQHAEEERARRLELERTARRAAERAAAALEARNDELFALAQARDDLVAAVSHELRTPLTSIQMFTELFAGETLSDAQREWLDVIVRNVDRLLVRVGDLLLLKDGTAVEIARETVELRVVAEEALEGFQPRADDEGVALELPSGADVQARCDAIRIAQVLDVLLDNALKFTPRGGRVAVSLAQEEDGLARIEVRDSGIGIPPTDLPHIFDRFFRGAASRELGRGVGFGLAIAEKLVRAQDGEISVDSTPGSGTTFTVLLPPAEG